MGWRWGEDKGRKGKKGGIIGKICRFGRYCMGLWVQYIPIWRSRREAMAEAVVVVVGNGGGECCGE
jgi:hypothetical protein